MASRAAVLRVETGNPRFGRPLVDESSASTYKLRPVVLTFWSTSGSGTVGACIALINGSLSWALALKRAWIAEAATCSSLEAISVYAVILVAYEDGFADLFASISELLASLGVEVTGRELDESSSPEHASAELCESSRLCSAKFKPNPELARSSLGITVEECMDAPSLLLEPATSGCMRP
jgi:hypothetical protein